MRAAWTNRAIGYAEDWSPSEHDLAVRIEEVWVRGYRLLTSTSQMERWLRAHRRAADEDDKPDEMIRASRNTHEHLDETLTIPSQSPSTDWNHPLSRPGTWPVRSSPAASSPA